MFLVGAVTRSLDGQLQHEPQPGHERQGQELGPQPRDQAQGRRGGAPAQRGEAQVRQEEGVHYGRAPGDGEILRKGNYQGHLLGIPFVNNIKKQKTVMGSHIIKSIV